MSEERRLLTAHDIAKRERLSVDTVKRALRNGRLKGYKVTDRGDWRVEYEQYELWVAMGAPTSQEPTE